MLLYIDNIIPFNQYRITRPPAHTIISREIKTGIINVIAMMMPISINNYYSAVGLACLHRKRENQIKVTFNYVTTDNAHREGTEEKNMSDDNFSSPRN